MMKRKKILLISLVIILLSTMVVYAIDHSSHYKKILLFPNHWEREPGLDIYVPYHYDQQGQNNYSYRISEATTAWETFEYSPFDDFYSISNKDDAELVIISKDYGDIGWVGKCYYTENPVRILINEYYHLNESGYTYSIYAEVISHELGHAHGLDHYDCDDEIMKPQGWIYDHNPYIGDKAGIYDIY